jgi:sarcosine oxidase/L-pipecolate oxidase
MMTPPGPDESDGVLDLLVIGGGVMGLFTAYHASQRFSRVGVIDRGRIGDPATASFGRSRSFRKDYLDPVYARLASEAIDLWTEFEVRTGTEVLVRCGCMNIANRTVTPDLGATYAEMTFETLQRLGMPMQSLGADEITRRFPFLRADVACLDPEGGLVNLPAVTEALLGVLAARTTRILEGVQITAIATEDDLVRVSTDAGDRLARSLVITAGHGTNDLLGRLAGCSLQIPITKDRPSEAKYYVPPASVRRQFTSDVMPVIAYLDTGIYLHPIVDGLVDAVKIGYYNPPDLPRSQTSVDNIGSFVAQCMPGLEGASVTEVVDVDQCDYDLVADDQFVLGPVPGFTNVFVGVGWRGTGYKFAPWVGRVLFELALQEGTIYDITPFDPARFDRVVTQERNTPR